MARLGSQEPTFQREGDWCYSDGPLIEAWYEARTGEGSGGSGVPIRLFPFQSLVLNMYAARTEDGAFASRKVGLSVPRRNGKSFSARLYVGYMAAEMGKKVLYSAHNGSTSSDMFREFEDMFGDPDSYPELAEYVVPNGIYRQPGAQRFTFDSGGVIQFNTRTRSKARGSGYEIIVIDEAQEFTDSEADTLLPTASASPASSGLVVEDPQIIYLGTPVYPGCPGTVFRRLRHRAHEGTGRRAPWWCEFGLASQPKQGMPEEEMTDLLYRTNPGLGYKVSINAILDSSDDLTWDGFCREIFGWWMPEDGGYLHAVESEAWEACATEDPPPSSAQGARVAYGVKFSHDGTHAAICAALAVPGLPTHVELVRCSDVTHGSAWLRSLLSGMTGDACCYLADGRGSADNLEADLRRGGAPRSYCRTATTKDVIGAFTAFVGMIGGGEVTHFSQQELTDSVVGSARRKIGNGPSSAFGFGDAPGVDSAPAEAAALAVMAVSTSKRDPHRVQRVVTF